LQDFTNIIEELST